MAGRGPGIQWREYTPDQAGIRHQVLGTLLKSGVLTGDEEEIAKGLLGKFSRASKSSESKVTIIVSEEGDQFIDRLEEAVWEMRR